MDHMTATTDDGETFTVGKVIEADRDKDVAVCLLPEGVRLPLLSFETEAPLRGEKTAVISSQFGVRNMVTLGNYCGSWNAGGVDWLLFSAPVSGGSSGAPVFNDRGNVIGIVTGTYEEGQTLNIATPASSVTDIYKKLSEGPADAGPAFFIPLFFQAEKTFYQRRDGHDERRRDNDKDREIDVCGKGDRKDPESDVCRAVKISFESQKIEDG